jgi:hypothetical protein
MQTSICEASRALAFARSHDWGADADLELIDGYYMIVGLSEVYVWTLDDGTSYTVGEPVDPMPATIRALREFGNY